MSTEPGMAETSKETRDKMRRKRNVQSAKRSRDRKKGEMVQLERQFFINEDRIRFLEKKVNDLTAELAPRPRAKPRVKPRVPSASSSSSSSRTSGNTQYSPSRPNWFGDPF